MTLLRRSFRSSLWVVGRIASRHLANAVLFFWLAVVLVPEDLGTAALAVTLPLYVLPAMIRGLRDGIIQRDVLNTTVINTALFLSLCNGLFFAGLLVAAAPVLAAVIGDPKLVMLSLVASTIPLIAALGTIQEALCERDFDHRRSTLNHICGAFIGTTTAVFVVLSGNGLWALVVYNVVFHMTVTSLFWLRSSWRPTTAWSSGEARRQIRFAVPIMISQTIAVGNQRLVELILGISLGPSGVAFYRFGSNFTRLLHQLLIAPVAQVLLPAFTQSKATPAVNMQRAITVNSFFLFPVAALLILLLPDLIAVVFGETWRISGVVASILCLGMAANLIASISVSLLVAQGEGKWTLVLAVITMMFVAGFVILGSQYGLLVATWAFVLSGVFTAPVTLWVMQRRLGIDPLKIVVAMLLLASLAGVSHLAAKTVQLWLVEAPFSVSGLAVLATGLAVYSVGFVKIVSPRMPEIKVLLSRMSRKSS